MTYTKQEWVDQETVISAARMDHIETGVDEAHDLSDTLGANIDAVEASLGATEQRLTDAEASLGATEQRLTDAEAALATLPQVQAGRVALTPTASTPTSADVTFGVPFRSTPEMTASAMSSVPGTVLEVTVDAITTTGARIWMNRSSSVPTSVSWIAVAN